MKKRNVIFISLDEVRADRLSCYGYDKIKTENMDKVAQEGVLFESHIAAGCYTGICMSSMLTGVYPNKHTLRDPFCQVQAPTIAALFKKQGYTTAGFSGTGVLGQDYGFKKGFDYFVEPSEDTAFNVWHPDESKEPFHIGYWWVDGHLYHTHRGGEVAMLEEGMLKEGENSEMFYMDGKIKATDELLFGRLLQKLKELKLEDNTTLIITSDHGTCVGEHPATPFDYVIYPDDPEREAKAQKELYPQHLNLFDVNVRTVMIMKDKDLPKGVRIPGTVRSVDMLPTLVDLLEIPCEGFDFDGTSYLADIKKGKAQGRIAYIENLHEWEGEKNAIVQALRTDDFKFIRNLADSTEQYYDLKKDPGEQNNIIEEVKKSRSQELLDLRKIMNEKLLKVQGSKIEFSEDKRKKAEDRLRKLGYMP